MPGVRCDIHHPAYGVERNLFLVQIPVVACRVKLTLITRHTAQRTEVYAYRAVNSTPVTHQAVVGNQLNAAPMLLIAETADEIHRLYLMVLKHPVHGAARYAHAATRAGIKLKIGITAPLHPLLHANLTEIDKQEFRKDMHVTGERHGYEKHAQHQGIEHP